MSEGGDQLHSGGGAAGHPDIEQYHKHERTCTPTPAAAGHAIKTTPAYRCVWLHNRGVPRPPGKSKTKCPNAHCRHSQLLPLPPLLLLLFQVLQSRSCRCRLPCTALLHGAPPSARHVLYAPAKRCCYGPGPGACCCSTSSTHAVSLLLLQRPDNLPQLRCSIQGRDSVLHGLHCSILPCEGLK